MTARLNRDGTITYQARSGEWREAATEIPFGEIVGRRPDGREYVLRGGALRAALLRAGWRFDLARKVWTPRSDPTGRIAGGLKG